MSFRRILIFVLVIVLEASLPRKALAEQVAYLSPQCPRTPEGMKYFSLGADFHFGRNGVTPSDALAEAYYEKTLRLGDSAAALNLGRLYQSMGLNRYDSPYRHAFAVRVFEEAAAMGCPDGYLALANAYSLVFSSLKDEKKSLHYLKLAVEHGSITAKAVYGKRLYSEGSEEKDPAKKDMGLALLEESLREGNGHVAKELAMKYRILGRAEDMIEALRQGCRLGSKKSLFSMFYVYGGDWFYGQPRDEKRLQRVRELYDSIADKDPIKPIPDFDKLVPPRPVAPVKKW